MAYLKLDTGEIRLEEPHDKKGWAKIRHPDEQSSTLGFMDVETRRRMSENEEQVILVAVRAKGAKLSQAAPGGATGGPPPKWMIQGEFTGVVMGQLEPPIEAK